MSSDRDLLDVRRYLENGDYDETLTKAQKREVRRRAAKFFIGVFYFVNFKHFLRNQYPLLRMDKRHTDFTLREIGEFVEGGIFSQRGAF